MRIARYAAYRMCHLFDSMRHSAALRVFGAEAFSLKVSHQDLERNQLLFSDKKFCLVLGCTFCSLVLALGSIVCSCMLHFSMLVMVQTFSLSQKTIRTAHGRRIRVRNQCLYRWSKKQFL